MVLFVGVRFPLVKFCRNFGQRFLDLPLNDDLRGIIGILSFGENKAITTLGKPDYNFFWDNKLSFRLSDLEEINIFGQLKRLEQPFANKYHLDLRVVRNKDGIQLFIGHEYVIDGYFILADLDQDRELHEVETRIKKAGFMDDLSNATFYELV